MYQLDSTGTVGARRAVDRHARLKERARCKAIFADASAAANPAMAAYLAFNTGMKSSAVIDVLRATPSAGARKPVDRLLVAAKEAGIRIQS
jgi:hypothetical protein